MSAGAFSPETKLIITARAMGMCEICRVLPVEQWPNDSNIGASPTCFTSPDLVKSNEAERWWNTERPLTHPSGTSREGLAVNATRINLNRNRGVRDPEVRFARATEWGEPPDHRPDLGPCLMFLGADNGNGYGQFAYRLFGRRGQYAHRYAWERVHGEIPDGLTVDHLCRVRMCVNVDHFELVPGVDNYLRGVATRTHCPNGHPYVQGMVGAGNSRCLICHAAQVKRSGERRTNAYRGLPNRRLKYDPVVRDAIVDRVVRRELSVVQGAAELGCAPKYMDKRARLRRRELGLPDLRPRKSL